MARRKKLNAAEMEQVFQRLSENNPEPKGELESVNTFTFLVAVVLSAQATDEGVNKATRGLFQAADTPEKMLALGEDKVREHIRTIGLYRNKAKNVIALSHDLVAKHDSQVPDNREALEALPGVGRKNRQCGFEQLLRATHHRHRHTPVQAGQPGWPGTRQDGSGRRAGPAQAGAESLPAACPSLADPARTLHLQGAQA